MATDVSIEVLPEDEETMTECSAASSNRFQYKGINITAETGHSRAYFHRSHWPPRTPADRNFSEDLFKICSKLLQEYKQAPSNNATEDDWYKPQIQRIPLLREKQSNKNCYDPLVVSIGPCHHGKRELEEFEKLKTPIAEKFARACEVSIEQLPEEVAKMGKSARKCYEKGSTEEYDDKLFNEMMLLDACFVLYFIMYTFPKTKGTNIKQKEEEADPLYGWSCYLGFVQRDLFLVENQIPLLVLKGLMKLLFKSERPEWETQLIQNFLDHKAIMQPPENWKLAMDEGSPAPHLLHLLRKQLIGSSPKDKKL